MTPTLVTTTQAVDTAFYVIVGINCIALLGVATAMVWFVWRYNRKRQPVPLSQKDKNLWLEIAWTVIPTLLVMLMFWYGWEGYLSLRRIPDDAMEVKATARMWSWLFTYGNGKSAAKLYVPAGQPVKIRLESEDVLHSFYVPAFRVKRDTVPGMTNWVWFVAERPGSYDLFCAEYCGTGHSTMVTTVEALPAAAFQSWLTAPEAAADTGKALLQKHGCLGCHSLDGSRLVGPSFQGIAGRRVELAAEGQPRQQVADRAYLEESIIAPQQAIVAGYPPAMPSFQGRIPEAELTAILDYLLTLAPGPPPAEPAEPPHGEDDDAAEATHDRAAAPSTPGEPLPAPPPLVPGEGAPAAGGKELAERLGCLGCHSVDGSRRVGPSFKGLFGQPRKVIREGKPVTVTADVAYLRRAIREPAAETVDGYPPAMPPFGQLGEAELQALIAWLETLH